MATNTESHDMVQACSLAELEHERRKVVSVNGRTVLVLLDHGHVFALDNRCPHMGFPLHRGSVEGRHPDLSLAPRQIRPGGRLHL